MKIKNFIGSKDIAKHLTKIKYKFNSTESAFIVWQSYKPLKEKQAAWKEIVDTMPDCDFFIGQPNKQDSLKLHTYLKSLLKNQEQFLNDFFKDDGGIYSYSPMYDSEDGEDYMDFNNGLFHDYLSCLETFKSRWGKDNAEIEFRMRKQYTDSPKDIVLTINLGQEVIRIDRYNGEEDVLGNRFKELFFEFPTPFQAGDILKYSDGIREKVFILTGLCLWEDHYPTRERGSADMTAHGCFQGMDESIYFDCVHNYLNCELCHDEYIGRSLLLLADFFYSKIGLTDLMNLYHAILLEQGSNQRQDEAEGISGIQTERYGFIR